jgi:hypothetical protein
LPALTIVVVMPVRLSVELVAELVTPFSLIVVFVIPLDVVLYDSNPDHRLGHTLAEPRCRGWLTTAHPVPVFCIGIRPRIDIDSVEQTHLAT